MSKTAQQIINSNPNMPLHVAENMIEMEKLMGKPYGEWMEKLIERYSNVDIMDLLNPKFRSTTCK